MTQIYPYTIQQGEKEGLQHQLKELESVLAQREAEVLMGLLELGGLVGLFGLFVFMCSER